ncbi:hypothetical protein [Psychromarinibacter halotolerans]|uniref:Uncharacterized protein n=1 Tax=Psychromarinibacter halotolerans TaxID=1775175 RepID=A0ABV7GZ12_9RHOB|nr:hypothetical protein [Psychromarinibacter halotolerans]MDF0596319.1 hypothetical protein [Psychromarinibacter halotolerans]
MAEQYFHYSDDERERLRRALREYGEAMKLTAQGLAIDITRKTNFALDFDAGRKRVSRFLEGKHRQPDDFIHAIAVYLGSVPPPDIEQGAATFAHFFSRGGKPQIDLAELAGRYHVYASTDRRQDAQSGFSEITVMSAFAEFSPAPVEPLASKVAYAVIEMKPMEKSNSLLVSENIVNFYAEPEYDSFPDELSFIHDAGVFVGFGKSDRAVPRFLMATRTVLETRLYRLYKTKDNPMTLRGELSFSGIMGRPNHMTHANPLHPEFEIEMVRIEDGGSGKENGIP